MSSTDPLPLPTAPSAGHTRRLATVLRYLVSGGLAAAVYVAVTSLANAVFHLPLVTAGILGYVISMPCAYVLHRVFSFASRQAVATEIPKFLLQSLVSSLLSGTLPALLTTMGLSLAIALVITSLAIPLLNYLTLSLWVFKTR